MTVKTKLLPLFLTCFALVAEFVPAQEAATNPAAIPNPDIARRQEAVQQALRRALEARTNAGSINQLAATPSAGVVPFKEGQTRFTTNAPGLNDPSNTLRPGPRPLPPRSNSIAIPSGGPSITNPSGPAAAAPATAEPTVAITPPPNTVDTAPDELIPPGTIEFRAADLNLVLQFYAELVNRTVLRSAGLAAPAIVLKTQTALTKREAVQALDAVLGMNGITMINVGDKFVKAVMNNVAPTAGQKFNRLREDQLPELGSYVTHVVQLKYAKPSELVQVLQPFAQLPNSILPIDSSQMLVLRDFTENVKRMLEMISEVDVVVPSEFISEVIPIKYALSSEIASALNSLSSGGGGTTVGAGSGSRGTGSSRMSGGFGRSTGTAGGYPGSNPAMGGQYGGQFGNPATPQAGTTPAAGGGTFTDRLRNIMNRAATSGDIQVIGQTKIIADERTNSLLIFASREDMRTIKDIVSKLDIVLAQVLIEAVIIEVSLGDSRNIGVSYSEQKQHGIGNYFTGIGAINSGNALSINNFPLSGATNAAGSLPGGFSYLASFGDDLDVTVTALASDSRAKILQRPRIQTSNAKQASLFVGQSRPYPTASYYGGGAYGGYSSIQQMQIGVSIEVTPLINPDGLVVMDIHQKIDSVAGTVNIVNVGDVPITSSKEAMASVAVRDHDTIILGGLIETSKNQSASGVPFLKDIPLLGYLFRSSTKSENRNELIVLIRPTVLPTPEVAALTAKAEKDNMPGVKRAEREILAEEALRSKQADKQLKKK